MTTSLSNDGREPRRLVLHCRAGFEGECAAEVAERANDLELAVAIDAPGGGALVDAVTGDVAGARSLEASLLASPLVFARAFFRGAAQPAELARADRVTGIAAAAARLGPPPSSVFVEHADSPEGRTLARLARALAGPLRGALPLAREGKRLHVLLLAGDRCLIGHADPRRASPWPMGIPRLRPPPGAPSRSALKLEEALLRLVPPAIRERLLGPGRTAIDLGASPGGWSLVLARRGLAVVAVDNGPLRGAAAVEPRIAHRRADAFRHCPPAPVDWMTCDVADKPARTAALVARWLEAGWCRACVFNLKLPMRRRAEAVAAARAVIERGAAGRRGRLRLAQLYHDREEVTGAWLPPG